MEYAVGAGLALGVGAFARLAGFDRDRAFYPAVLVVIASYYDLFAVVGGGHALAIEIIATAVFVCASVIGFRANLWIVAGALVAHGLFDLAHGRLIANTGVPGWWPMFCLSFDVLAGGYVAWLLVTGRLAAKAGPRADARARPLKPVEDLAAAVAIARTTTGVLLSGVMVVFMLVSASACSTASAQTRLARVDDHDIAYRVLGTGGPVVVMLAGLGDDMTTFQDVAPELAKSATVIVYDRSGYGGSGVAAGPRDAAGVERELSGLLAQTGLPAPYVLAGHSLGGLFAEYYAARHPEQIAGLILEESRPADFARLCEAAGLSMCTPLPSMMRTAVQGAQDEVLVLPVTEAQVRAAGAVSGKPVLILSRPQSADQRSFGGQWSIAQVGLAVRYPGSRHLVAAGGGHVIHHDQRAWYLASVQEFLGALDGSLQPEPIPR